MPAAERLAHAGDLRLRVSPVDGDGRPLLQVAGIGANVAMWRPLRRPFAERATLSLR